MLSTRLEAANGEVMATGEGYKTKAGAENGITSPGLGLRQREVLCVSPRNLAARHWPTAGCCPL
ncbi:YegP family protein [Mycobacterium intracellulare]|uniref:YegP family protein n=1 Tax=Mycobacterium intracellulare TaxID=1767 RepID=UPI00331454DA